MRHKENEQFYVFSLGIFLHTLFYKASILQNDTRDGTHV